MTIHRLAIDETGSFNIREDDKSYNKSFVCGIAVSANEETVKQKYKQCYEAFGLGTPAPNDTQTLIGAEAFHFNALSGKKKEICRKNMLPFADKIFVSKGKPALFANNQNWWLVAVTVVISEYLRTERFEQDDKVEILIDNRNDKTFGLIDDDHVKNPGFKEYHNILKKQIKKNVGRIADARKIVPEIYFLSDTSSFFINLADVVCGFVRKDKSTITAPIAECHCSRFGSGDDPAAFIGSNPMMAISLIFQEIAGGKMSNASLIDSTLMKKLRTSTDNYAFVWDMFYDLLKIKIDERVSHSKLLVLKSLVDIFLAELINTELAALPAGKRLDLMVLFVEYYSHIGNTEMPFDKKLFLEAINDTEKNSETRALRKWEKFVSFSLHEAQIRFNGYDFTAVANLFEQLWGAQENIMSCIPDTLIYVQQKDEPTTAITGTLAQSHAYIGECEKAVEYFEMSKAYAIKTPYKTDSYLFTIYHRNKDVENARKCFLGQTAITPEEYALKKDFANTWQLLSYCKLRALELYANKSTDLPAVELQSLSNYNSEYPFPLVQKWEGIALWRENAEANRSIVEMYFTDAITNLLESDNGFAVKTLALPVIQCLALVNNRNQFHAKYNSLLDDLKKQSNYFADFVSNKVPLLNSIKNNADIWERAMSLPFIYA